MKLFLKNMIYILAIPIVIILTLYVIFDPFKVLYHYNEFYPKTITNKVGLNKGYISLNNFINNYPKYKYNSFIFGNSRSIYYEIKEWEKHLPADSKCYHFDGNGEAIYNIYKKLLFLDKNNIQINNALLVIDYDVLVQDKSTNKHLSIIPPRLENYKNVFTFHFSFT